MKKIKKVLQKFAKDNNCILNPDENLVNKIIESLIHNEKKTGYSYCPCRPVSNPRPNPDLICPCDFMNSDVWKKKGGCHCSLFLKK